jgi:hypothetical protein
MKRSTFCTFCKFVNLGKVALFVLFVNFSTALKPNSGVNHYINAYPNADFNPKVTFTLRRRSSYAS